MKSNDKKPDAADATHILGDDEFAAISEVEGLKLGASSRHRLAELKARNLTPAQKRLEVLRAYADEKKR